MSLKRRLEEDEKENNWGSKKQKCKEYVVSNSGNKGEKELVKGVHRRGRVRKYKVVGLRKRKVVGEGNHGVELSGVLLRPLFKDGWKLKVRVAVLQQPPKGYEAFILDFVKEWGLP